MYKKTGENFLPFFYYLFYHSIKSWGMNDIFIIFAPLFIAWDPFSVVLA